MLLHELGGLEAFGEFGFYRVPDYARAGEADHGFGLGDDDVAKECEARRDAGGGRVGHDGDVEAFLRVVAGDGRGGLGHLHEADEALLHSGAAGAGEDDGGEVLVGGAFDGGGDFLADDGAHGAHDEEGVHYGEDDRSTFDISAAGEDGFGQAGLFLGGGHSLGVGDAVRPIQGVGGDEVGVEFLEGAGVGELADTGAGVDAIVVAALGADEEVLLEHLSEDHLAAALATEPEAFRDFDFGHGGRIIVDRSLNRNAARCGGP